MSSETPSFSGLEGILVTSTNLQAVSGEDGQWKSNATTESANLIETQRCGNNAAMENPEFDDHLPVFIMKFKGWMHRNQLSQRVVAPVLNLSQSHLCDLLNAKKQGFSWANISAAGRQPYLRMQKIMKDDMILKALCMNRDAFREQGRVKKRVSRPYNRNRLSLTIHQKKILEDAYTLAKYPSTTEYQKIATTLGITFRQVKTWFNNRRKLRYCPPSLEEDSFVEPMPESVPKVCAGPETCSPGSTNQCRLAYCSYNHVCLSSWLSSLSHLNSTSKLYKLEKYMKRHGEDSREENLQKWFIYASDNFFGVIVEEFRIENGEVVSTCIDPYESTDRDVEGLLSQEVKENTHHAIEGNHNATGGNKHATLTSYLDALEEKQSERTEETGVQETDESKVASIEENVMEMEVESQGFRRDVGVKTDQMEQVAKRGGIIEVKNGLVTMTAPLPSLREGMVNSSKGNEDEAEAVRLTSSNFVKASKRVEGEGNVERVEKTGNENRSGDIGVVPIMGQANSGASGCVEKRSLGMTDMQLKFLQLTLEMHGNPSQEILDALSVLTCLEKDQIREWFKSSLEEEALEEFAV